MEWKDESSYSRNEKRIPNNWKASPGMFRLAVHRHIHQPGHWFVSCEPFWSVYPLVAESEEAAKAEAQGMLTRALRDALKDLE